MTPQLGLTSTFRVGPGWIQENHRVLGHLVPHKAKLGTLIHSPQQAGREGGREDLLHSSQ